MYQPLQCPTSWVFHGRRCEGSHHAGGLAPGGGMKSKLLKKRLLMQWIMYKWTLQSFTSSGGPESGMHSDPTGKTLVVGAAGLLVPGPE